VSLRSSGEARPQDNQGGYVQSSSELRRTTAPRISLALHVRPVCPGRALADAGSGHQRETLGLDHPDVALSVVNLAQLRVVQGQPEKAEPLYRRALAIRERALGPSHLARTIHEYLLRRPILSPGGAFLVRPPRRTARTPTAALRARSPGGLRSQTPRDGIHE